MCSYRICANEVKTIIDLQRASFEYCPSVAGIIEKARHTLRMVLDDELRRIAISDFYAICGESQCTFLG
jgi:hypothetical protein